jgi:hypothetical protein
MLRKAAQEGTAAIDDALLIVAAREETIRALRQACPNTVGPPAGFDDPRCPGVVPR